MVNTHSAQHGSPKQGRGRGQLPSGNPASHTVPPLTTQPQHIEGTGENNPNSTGNLNPIAAQLNVIQQQFGVFQLVLVQLLARDNPGDPLIALLNPTNQMPTQRPQHVTSPVRTATLPRNDSPAHSHMAPLPQPPPQPVASDLPRGNFEKVLPENRTPQTPTLPSSAPIPTPLNPSILQESYPSGFRMPHFETYDGTKDPDDHLHAFCSIMQAQNASDALMCKIFPSTLRGNARTWYYSLQPSSVSSYAELAAFFATKFSSRRLIKKTTSELMRVAQRKGESFKNYMNRFNDAVLEISSFNHGVGLAALTAGLKHDRFRDSLIKHAPTTFDEANERSWKFIQAEEYALSGKATPSKEVRPPTWREEGQSKKRFKPVQNRGPLQPRTDRPPTVTQPMSKQITWTPFILPRSQILMQIKNKMELRRPLPMRSPPTTRDHSKYCDFHQDHGHTTEECQSLKSKLEGLARKGMLNEYVSKGDQPRFVREQGRPQAPREASNRVGVGYQQTPPPLPPPSRIIHMITGGLEAGGMSLKQQKLYVREVKHQNRVQKRKFDETDWRNQPITFSAVDFDGVITPHNDPLVTSVIVNSCEVHRVLVDTGSAPDIMYYHCFESLGLDPALLQKYDGPIYGFNNQPVPVEGVLTLKVAFGSGRTYVTPSVRFLVVKMASSFNIVIRRPTLTEIRAVVSQSHLCMKFPTPMGVATLRGNQEVARHCYMTSVTLPQRDKLITPAPIQAEIPSTQQVMGIELPDYRPNDDARATPVEEVEEIQLDPNDPTRKTQIGIKLKPEEKGELIDFLKSNRDVFAWTSADMPGIPASVAVHKLGTNPIEALEVSTDPETPSWTDPIKAYLQDGTVPPDKQEELKLRRKASRYTLLDGILYKRSYSLPLLRCLTPYEAEYALREVHEGVCGSHVRARTLAHKVLRQGYYWPNMQEDAARFVQKCQKCQFFAHLTHQPAEELRNLVAPWPFAQWGLDLLGPFVKGVGGVTHLVVAVDYFTKWVEARPLSSLTSRRIEDFVFSAIICRYGIPNQIVTDNGPQFNCTSFRDFYYNYGIKLLFTSVYHPETNGMVESMNKTILEGLKPRLDQLKAKWADELNNVLWAYRTTTRTATGMLMTSSHTDVLELTFLPIS
ncbi:hypothetical protein SLEP1_g26507 [Rubroshorea leprosula]|uniref:Integrase catalytic domain-containing protein n=1 Tax=Rubroshorea leprosula TaxID=152421 RepID=A0AAV5JMH3_9ROSI|nr:hypothetical protein SLEP1_g26507 [Rubroshorea leprosula]